MARRTDTVTATEGRDKGKRFLITEMPAYTALRWAVKALLALTNAGASVPDESTGMAGLAAVGFEALSKLNAAVAQPLLDEMLLCVQCIPKASGVAPEPLVTDGLNDQVEEVATYLTLYKAVFKLHTGFSQAGSTPTMG